MSVRISSKEFTYLLFYPKGYGCTPLLYLFPSISKMGIRPNIWSHSLSYLCKDTAGWFHLPREKCIVLNLGLPESPFFPRNVLFDLVAIANNVIHLNTWTLLIRVLQYFYGLEMGTIAICLRFQLAILFIMHSTGMLLYLFPSIYKMSSRTNIWSHFILFASRGLAIVWLSLVSTLPRVL